MSQSLYLRLTTLNEHQLVTLNNFLADTVTKRRTTSRLEMTSSTSLLYGKATNDYTQGHLASYLKYSNNTSCTKEVCF